jgi:hypothetical protein
MADRSMCRTPAPGYGELRNDERIGLVDTMTEQTNEISSALRCRLTQAAPKPVDPEIAHRHLLLQDIAQNAVLEAEPATRRGLFRRSR